MELLFGANEREEIRKKHWSSYKSSTTSNSPKWTHLYFFILHSLAPTQAQSRMYQYVHFDLCWFFIFFFNLQYGVTQSLWGSSYELDVPCNHTQYCPVWQMRMETQKGCQGHTARKKWSRFWTREDFPGGPVVDSELPMQGVWVRSLGIPGRGG